MGCIARQQVILYVPFLAKVFAVCALDWHDWVFGQHPVYSREDGMHKVLLFSCNSTRIHERCWSWHFRFR